MASLDSVHNTIIGKLDYDWSQVLPNSVPVNIYIIGLICTFHSNIFSWLDSVHNTV